MKFISNAKKILDLLSNTDRRNGVYILFLVTGMAILETIGVASVMPFLAVLGNPSIIDDSSALTTLYIKSIIFGINNHEQFLIFLGLISFLLILLSVAYRIFALYEMNNFIENCRHNIGSRIFTHHLKHDYEYFIKTHSAEITKSVVSTVSIMITYVLRPFVNMVANIFVLIAILFFLIIINPYIALLSFTTLGLIYLIIYKLSKRLLTHLGNAVSQSDKGRFISISHALGGAKLLKLFHLERYYLNLFRKHSAIFSQVQAKHQTITIIPNFLMEGILFGGIIALTIFLIINGGGLGGPSLGSALPLLGLYAFAAYRLKPCVQHIYSGISGMHYGKSSVDSLYETISSGQPKTIESDCLSESFTFETLIELKNVSYKYPASDTFGLNKINLKIKPGDLIGIIGSSGAGKTTLVDIIIGLLDPTSGSVLHDFNEIKPNKKKPFQKLFGYVPQDVYLSDDTIAQNIAIGVEPNEIDYKKLIEVSKTAQLHTFIDKDLHLKYDTIVGEKGVSLSGGQIQRIGIARALYKDPSIIVFDEATSALDISTEEKITKTILDISKNKTIILIAHRLSTVEHCNKIVVLDEGRIKTEDSYENLKMRNLI
jgi:ABC-type multidrug transport system fused ATPase/permease subunit